MSTNHTTCHEKKEESLILSHCLKEGWVFSAHFSAKISPILRPKDISVMLDQMTRSYGARQNSGCAILKIYMCQVLVRVTLCCVCVQFIFTILPINQRLASGALASPLIGKMALLQKWHCIPLCPKEVTYLSIFCLLCDCKKFYVFWGAFWTFRPIFSAAARSRSVVTVPKLEAETNGRIWKMMVAFSDVYQKSGCCCQREHCRTNEPVLC